MDYHASLQASLDAFERIISRSSTMVQTLKKLCGDLDKSKSSDKEPASHVSQLQHRLDRMSGELMELMDDYASLDAPIVEIPCLEAERSKLDMTYISGDNPWEFSLSYSNKGKLKEIREVLEVKHKQNSLQRFVIPPKEGQFVVCHAGKKLFRAKILKCFPNGRLRVLKIDSNEEGLVQTSNIYQVPQEIAAIPCQTLQCCLNKEDEYLKERWVKDLQLIFSKTLSECRLTVDILEKLNCFSPPKFHVRMYVYNDEVQEEINLSSWINGKLLADLKLLSLDGIDDLMAVLDEECMDPFSSSQSKTDDNILCPKPTNLNMDLDPSSYNKESASNGPANWNSVPDVVENELNSQAAQASDSIDKSENLDEPDSHSIGLSVEKVSTWMEQYSDEETIKSKQKATKYDVPKLEEPSFSFSKAKTSLARDVDKARLDPWILSILPLPSVNGTGGRSSNTSTSTSANLPLTSVNGTGGRSSNTSTSTSANLPLTSVNGTGARSSNTSTSTSANLPLTSVNGTGARSLNTSPSPSIAKVTTPASSSRQLDKESATSGRMSVNAPEFVPCCYVEIKPGANEESFENVISNFEDEYQPKDEKRICLFYQKKGFCNRTACTKEHIKRTNKWTLDEAEIEKGPYNNIDLPREGCETFLRVQHVETANTFFSTLHEIYSDINEYGTRETFETLYQDLNSLDGTSPHPLLETIPSITERVLALGLQRTLGPKRKWLRAMVTEILDTSTMEVFFSDFGNREIVPIKDIRQIRPQFLHLPSQAVLTTLASVQIVPEQRKAGKTFLGTLIKGKTLKAKVMSRDVINTEMEVILYTEDNTCINNLIVDQGYCVPF